MCPAQAETCCVCLEAIHARTSQDEAGIATATARYMAMTTKCAVCLHTAHCKHPALSVPHEQNAAITPTFIT